MALPQMGLLEFLIVFFHDCHQSYNRPIAFFPANGKSGDGASFANHLGQVAADIFPSHNPVFQQKIVAGFPVVMG